MKILITGTAGFIGFHFAKYLSDKEIEVFGLDNINDYYDINLKYARLKETGIKRDKISYGEKITSKKYSNYQFIKLNLEDKEKINELFKAEKFDIVCNLAAQPGVRYSITNPHAYINSNIVGFTNIIEACRHNDIKHFVYASSSSIYGSNEKLPFTVNDNTDHPVSLYAATKKANELIAHTYSHLYKLPTTGLRFFTVYGPWGRPDMAPFLFTKAITENKPINIFNNGNMKRDFTYIDDIVRGISLVIDKPAKPNLNWSAKKPETSSSAAPYKIYNIGNNNPVNLMDFINEIEKTLNKAALKNYMPMQDGDLVTTYADVTDLINDFKYKPDTSLDTGIKKFIDWYKEFYKKS